MNPAASTYSEPFSSTDIAECVKVSLKAHGLDHTRKCFEGMEQLLSRLPWWSEVKAVSDQLFAEERERQEQLKLAQARASAPNIYQLLPSAQTGVNMDVGVNSPGNMIANTINKQTNQNKQ